MSVNFGPNPGAGTSGTAQRKVKPTVDEICKKNKIQMLYFPDALGDATPLPQEALIEAGNALVDATTGYVKVAKKTNMEYTMVEYSSDPSELAKRLRPFTYAVLPEGASMGVVTYIVPSTGTPVLETSTVVKYRAGKKVAIVCGPVYDLYTPDMSAKFDVDPSTNVATPKDEERFAARYTGATTVFLASWSRTNPEWGVQSMVIKNGDYLIKDGNFSYRVAKEAFDKTYEVV